MEKKETVKKVRWFVRYKSVFGLTAVVNKSGGIRYWDSFKELSEDVAERVDANPDMVFQFVKEYYYA